MRKETKKELIAKIAKEFEKEATSVITPSRFLQALQNIMIGRITKKDNERAYDNKLMTRVVDLPKELRQNLQVLLNQIVGNMSEKINNDGLLSVDEIYIKKDQMERLKFLLPTCLNPKINVGAIGFKHIKDAIRSAYEIKMRRV